MSTGAQEALRAYFEQVISETQRLGVDEPLRPALGFLRRADSLDAELSSRRAGDEKTFGRLVQAVTAGRLPVDELPAKARELHAWVFDSLPSRILIQAQAACHSSAQSAARAAAPALFKLLQTEVDKVVSESARLTATLPAGVDSEASAMRAGNGDAKHFKTWQGLRQRVDRWTALHLLALLLVARVGWLPGPKSPMDTPDALVFMRYERPLSLPPNYWVGPGELRLAKAAASNAAPGMYGWADALQRWQRVDRRRREYRIFSSRQSMDAMGNITTLESGPEQPQESVPVPIGSQPIVPAV